MKSPLGWPGGKTSNKLADSIVRYFPPTCTTYVEPFMGSLAVLFAKKRWDCEIVNDVHSELVNLFLMIKFKPDELTTLIDLTFSSEKMYKQLKAMNPKKLSKVQRAFRFMYLVKNAYGQRYGDTWGLYAGRTPGYNATTLRQQVNAIYHRLEKVQITCRDYKRLRIDSLDKPETLYYLDPPYFNVKHDKGYGGSPILLKDFRRWVFSIKHAKVAISHDYDRRVLRAFKGWHVVEVGQRQNSLSRHKSGDSKGNNSATELLITNYEPTYQRRRRSFV